MIFNLHLKILCISFAMQSEVQCIFHNKIFFRCSKKVQRSYSATFRIYLHA